MPLAPQGDHPPPPTPHPPQPRNIRSSTRTHARTHTHTHEHTQYARANEHDQTSQRRNFVLMMEILIPTAPQTRKKRDMLCGHRRAMQSVPSQEVQPQDTCGNQGAAPDFPEEEKGRGQAKRRGKRLICMLSR